MFEVFSRQEHDFMKTMLIADEDQRTKNIVRYTFELKGYNVVGASKGSRCNPQGQRN